MAAWRLGVRTPRDIPEPRAPGPGTGWAASHLDDTGQGPPLKVLHVVEALGGGVATVVEDYIRSTPEHDHMLLAWRRPGVQTGDQLDALVVRSAALPSGLLAQFWTVRRLVSELQPDIVHAHSSIAGALTRLRMPDRRRTIVYTPHCFAFERRDLPSVGRGGFWVAEAVMSLGGTWVAAVSQREADLARAMPGHPTSVVIPQLAPTLPATRPRTDLGRDLHVVASGRLSPQKDPAWFGALVREGLRRQPTSRWTWVGGGTPEQESSLRSLGATVTGWMPRTRALQVLGEADAYVHTAAWEGAPMSVFEAASMGLPVLGRRIPALESLGLTALADRPDELARLLLGLVDDPSRRSALVEESRALVARHSRQSQRTALLNLYRRVAPAPAVPQASG